MCPNHSLHLAYTFRNSLIEEDFSNFNVPHLEILLNYDFNSVRAHGPGRGLRFYISNKVPGGIDAVL